MIEKFNRLSESIINHSYRSSSLMAIVLMRACSTRVGEGKMKIVERRKRKGKIDKEVNAERFRN